MKRVAIISLTLIIGLCLATGAFAADKNAIKKQVDDIVVAIDGGKMATDFASAAQNKPNYVFIMEESGMLLVHPSLVGQSLKEKAEPAYKECVKATAEGVWVSYEWKGKKKHTYVRKTKSGLIVGSGY
jgi:Cache domain